ncbi:spore gernimation protein GerPD [Priestia flexa]|jgi:spore germination protein PD|uniref:Spore gernimation protein GerPD n=2 Tax=Priestia TaxID=2800373 RepID=A0A0V8JIL5_9BACI|nr:MULTISPECIES: spore gernimation protein GerPD [Bacillaceae]AQX55860.1 spore gernimation protein GerPD [Priestia flexa]KSU86809.1 spore gernimation protein GerPD [Priestia veravalensis]KZB90287.1 spore gernimation protein GerPD [Bacillus sp. VT 712]MBN8251209.1 spore gernimation protein GerPD [Priestia flexa]MBN8433413.1 spore gernimation protein GerPD [Priestia flexa]
MNYTVINRELMVGNIDITGVSSSSVFLIGDAHYINLSATFDTPAESLIIGPYVPLSLS